MAQNGLVFILFMSKTIILAGGTGLIGTRLTALLEEKGHRVRILTRTPRREGQYQWDPYAGTIDNAVFEGADAIINLAGSGIADRRWTNARKKDLIDSRVKSIETLRNALKTLPERPSVFVTASAVGIYGDSGETLQTEATPVAPPPRSFMVECCDQWEKAADTMAEIGLRTVKIRIGVVLTKEGGALKEIARPVSLGVGAYFDDGQAWTPWIHLDDICRVFLWAVENNQMEGVYNGVSPHPVRNYDLTKATVKAMDKWALLVPAPAFALRLVLGEMSAVVLNSNLVSAEKLTKTGFQFQFPDVEGALLQIWQ